MIDVAQQINAVQRQVGGRVIEAGEARSVIISQAYAAPVEDVWDACTSPDRIPRWFLPVTGDLRLGGRTRLRIEHLALAGDERWAEFGPGATGVGWDMALLGLAGHLSAGPTVRPADGAVWAASGAGRQFMSLSSDRWRDASVAAGTDPAEARVSAGRTLAAYTGQPGSTDAGTGSATQ